MYPSINVFGIEIASNWVMILFSFVIMSIVNIKRVKKINLKWYHGIIISFLVNILAILSAHILFKIENINSKGFGLSFFGTVFFLPIFMYFVGKLYKINHYVFSDIWALTIPLELSFVRLGCFLSGCCMGIIHKHGIHFPFETEGTYRLPVQLYECILDLGIFIFLIIYEKKNKKGILYPTFMIFYGTIRFFLEYLRDTPKNNIGLSNGQLFSFISILIGLIIALKILKKKKKNV